jgi:hypothetical protein
MKNRKKLPLYLKEKTDEERIWQEKALALYPTNRFRETLIRQAGK